MRKKERIDPSQLDLKDFVVSINRVTKVVKGGKNLSFSALVVVGDGAGHVGFAKGKAREIETRGISDHGFIRSIYFRDPNGYVIELTAKMPNHARAMDPATNGARAKLDQWSARKHQQITAMT